MSTTVKCDISPPPEVYVVNTHIPQLCFGPYMTEYIEPLPIKIPR